ncbi:hypothetical protein, partial [Aeromonas veronii]|uniref:hypothetical protein n=1 Tax=Aeromonas veronii TaxID=654 RepID=UPI00195CB180
NASLRGGVFISPPPPSSHPHRPNSGPYLRQPIQSKDVFKPSLSNALRFSSLLKFAQKKIYQLLCD